MHVEDQVDRHPLLDHAGQQQPREEGLARARLAEDAARPLDQPLQVQGDLDALHVQRRADVEVVRRLSADLPHALLAEDLVDLGLAGGGDRREVLRHGLDRLRLVLAILQDEQRAEVHRAEGGRALVDRGQERVGHVRRLLGDQRVGAVQRHVGDHAEEARPPPPRHHVAAHGHVLKAATRGRA